MAEFEQARERGEQVVAPAPMPYDRATQERRAKRAERELAELGRVNPLALEEFAALEERYNFLSTQLEDVKAARKDLLDVIADVDARILQVFSEAYIDVEREFREVFAALFPGGEGRLLLTDPDDMLTTGIEVEARPPGKKIKRLSLLSGGEKSLTAVAMLVAIFRARPSPFYIMDEVEAALDDTNLRRLIGLFELLRAKSQLIVITHQKPTMEVADALYGVTMRDDGITAVISQRMRGQQVDAAGLESDQGRSNRRWAVLKQCQRVTRSLDRDRGRRRPGRHRRAGPRPGAVPPAADQPSARARSPARSIAPAATPRRQASRSAAPPTTRRSARHQRAARGRRRRDHSARRAAGARSPTSSCPNPRRFSRRPNAGCHRHLPRRRRRPARRRGLGDPVAAEIEAIAPPEGRLERLRGRLARSQNALGPQHAGPDRRRRPRRRLLAGRRGHPAGRRPGSGRHRVGDRRSCAAGWPAATCAPRPTRRPCCATC